MASPTPAPYTRLGYTYRDTRGLMHAAEIYYVGAIGPAERDAIIAKLRQPHNEFIPSQVGLPDLQPEFWRRRNQAGPGLHDQVWHELAALGPCEKAPFPPNKQLGELLTAFRDVSQWHESAAAVALINAYSS